MSNANAASTLNVPAHNKPSPNLTASQPPRGTMVVVGAGKSYEKTHPTLHLPRLSKPVPLQKKVEPTPKPQDLKSKKKSDSPSSKKSSDKHGKTSRDKSRSSSKHREKSSEHKSEHKSRSTIKEKSSSKDNDKELAELNKKVKDLETEISEIKKQRDHFQSEHQKSSHAHKENESLKDEISKLKDEMSKVKAASLKNPKYDDLLYRYCLLALLIEWGDYDARLKKAEIKRLNDELDKLKHLQHERDEYKNLYDEAIKKSKDKLSNENNDRKRLENERDQYKQLHDNCKEKSRARKGILRQMEKDHDNLKRHCHERDQEIDDLKRRLRETERKASTSKEKDSRLREMEKDMEDMRQRLRESNKKAELGHEKDARLREMEKDNDDLRRRLRELKDRDHKLRECYDENENLKKMLHARDQELKNMDDILRAKKAKMKSAYDRCCEAENRCQILEEKLKNSRRAKEIEAKYQKLREEHDALLEQLDDKNRKLDKNLKNSKLDRDLSLSPNKFHYKNEKTNKYEMKIRFLLVCMELDRLSKCHQELNTGSKAPVSAYKDTYKNSKIDSDDDYSGSKNKYSTNLSTTPTRENYKETSVSRITKSPGYITIPSDRKQSPLSSDRKYSPSNASKSDIKYSPATKEVYDKKYDILSSTNKKYDYLDKKYDYSDSKYDSDKKYGVNDKKYDNYDNKYDVVNKSYDNNDKKYSPRTDYGITGNDGGKSILTNQNDFKNKDRDLSRSFRGDSPKSLSNSFRTDHPQTYKSSILYDGDGKRTPNKNIDQLENDIESILKGIKSNDQGKYTVKADNNSSSPKSTSKLTPSYNTYNNSAVATGPGTTTTTTTTTHVTYVNSKGPDQNKALLDEINELLRKNQKL